MTINPENANGLAEIYRKALANHAKKNRNGADDTAVAYLTSAAWYLAFSIGPEKTVEALYRAADDVLNVLGDLPKDD